MLQIGPQLVQEKPHWASNLINEAQIGPQMLVTFYFLVCFAEIWLMLIYCERKTWFLHRKVLLK
jgi:hypothetical protein